MGQVKGSRRGRGALTLEAYCPSAGGCGSVGLAGLAWNCCPVG